MAVLDEQVPVSDWEKALAKHWIKVLNALLEDEDKDARALIAAVTAALPARISWTLGDSTGLRGF